MFCLEELLSSVSGGQGEEIETDPGLSDMARAKTLLVEALDMDEEGRQVTNKIFYLQKI